MHWSIYALFSAIFAGLVALFGKLGLKNIDSTLATTVRSIIMAVFLVIVAGSMGKFSGISAIHGKALLLIILSGVAGALSWLFYFIAIKQGPVAGVLAIDRTSIVFGILLAVLFVGEALTWKSVIGSILIVGGALVIAL